jgi:hypothetical protein
MCLSDKVTICDLVKGGTSLVEVVWHYGKSESSICSAFLNSVRPEHSQFSLRCGLLDIIYLWTPQICCICADLEMADLVPLKQFNQWGLETSK